jgi:hypothetical protein
MATLCDLMAQFATRDAWLSCSGAANTLVQPEKNARSASNWALFARIGTGSHAGMVTI